MSAQNMSEHLLLLLLLPNLESTSCGTMDNGQWTMSGLFGRAKRLTKKKRSSIPNPKIKP